MDTFVLFVASLLITWGLMLLLGPRELKVRDGVFAFVLAVYVSTNVGAALLSMAVLFTYIFVGGVLALTFRIALDVASHYTSFFETVIVGRKEKAQ